MKIIILTQFYPPEVGAPQFRISDMAMRLQRLGNEITVFTAMPNYPQMVVHKEYRGKWRCREVVSGITIWRSWIYVGKTRTFLNRIGNYFSFVFSSLLTGLFVLPRADILLCESPPLFLGISAYLLAKAKKARLVFNVSDLWPESAVRLGVVKNKWLIRISEKLEAFLYKHSALVTGQTKGICTDIQKRFPDVPTYWWRNGIDVENFTKKIDPYETREKYNFQPTDFILLYAGILGLAQGMEIIPEAAEILKQHADIKFFVVGDGPEKGKLLFLKNKLQLNQLILHEVVPREQISGLIACANASIIPLKKLELFRSAIPSKIFESLVMRKPILLGVDGEARELFIDQGECGLFYEPGNAADLASKILYLKTHPDVYAALSQNAFTFVITHFSREKIAEEMGEELQNMLINKSIK